MIFHRLIKRFHQRPLKRLTSRSAYKLWAQNYPPTPHNRLMEIEQEAMMSVMPTLSDKVVLDLACGTGRYALIAEQQLAQQVICIDDSFSMIHQVQSEFRLLGSMNQIPLMDNSFDVILCGLAVGHSQDLTSIIYEISRLLVSGGQAVISDFHPEQYLNGARRTFMSDEGVYEVEHYAHVAETWEQACQQSGLLINAVVEPRIEGQSMPVVIVYRLVKT